MVSTADSDVEAVSVGGGRGQERCVGSSQEHTELCSPPCLLPMRVWGHGWVVVSRAPELLASFPFLWTEAMN